MTVDQFINSLDQYGENLHVGQSNSWWEQAIEKVKSDLLDLNITSNRSNVKAGAVGEEVFIEMAEYLLYQNYGVKAADFSKTPYNLTQDPVDRSWGAKPSGGSIYQFGVGKSSTNGWGAIYSGLDAKRDFKVDDNGFGDYNIQQEFINYFNEIVNQQSEL